MCVAERAKMELMTKSYPKAASKKLDREREPTERRVDRRNLDLPGNLLHPQRALHEVGEPHIPVNTRQMMDQAQINRRKAAKMLRRLQIHFRKGESACALPCFDLALDPRSPKKIRLFQGARSFFRRRMIHVVTPTVVLCTIFTVSIISP